MQKAAAMKEKQVTILGEQWILDICPRESYPGLEEADGYCDDTLKHMVICDHSTEKPHPQNKGDYKAQIDKNVRHEMLHAFLFASGLGICSEWAENEEMIDWFARQFPKLVEAMKSVGAL